MNGKKETGKYQPTAGELEHVEKRMTPEEKELSLQRAEILEEVLGSPEELRRYSLREQKAVDFLEKRRVAIEKAIEGGENIEYTGWIVDNLPIDQSGPGSITLQEPLQTKSSFPAMLKGKEGVHKYLPAGTQISFGASIEEREFGWGDTDGPPTGRRVREIRAIVSGIGAQEIRQQELKEAQKEIEFRRELSSRSARMAEDPEEEIKCRQRAEQAFVLHELLLNLGLKIETGVIAHSLKAHLPGRSPLIYIDWVSGTVRRINRKPWERELDQQEQHMLEQLKSLKKLELEG